MNDGATGETIEFVPSRWLNNRHLQSMLPSFSPRRWGVERRCAALLESSRDLILDCGDGVRLLANLAERDGARRLVVILHGWEGSSSSLYVLSLGQYLFERGFNVLRLNLRDHGPTHHLNRGLFHSCRLDDVAGAVERVAATFPSQRLYFAGFSLGGNFGLRVGALRPRAAAALTRIAAVCPVLDPQHTMRVLEEGPFVYRHYFVSKWRQSLRLKQAAWPDEYDFGAMAHLRGLTAMTEHLVLRHTEFPSLAAYLAGYAITGEALGCLRTPSRIIAAEDDPIIPAGDYARIARPPGLDVRLLRQGGHCGFRERVFNSLWLERQIHEFFAAAG